MNNTWVILCLYFQRHYQVKISTFLKPFTGLPAKLLTFPLRLGGLETVVAIGMNVLHVVFYLFMSCGGLTSCPGYNLLFPNVSWDIDSRLLQP